MTEPRTVQVFTKDINEDRSRAARNFAPQVVTEKKETNGTNPKGVGVASSSPVTNEPIETPAPEVQDQLDFEDQSPSPEAEPAPHQNPSAPKPSGESPSVPDSSPSPAPRPLTFPPSQPSQPQVPAEPVIPNDAGTAGE